MCKCKNAKSCLDCAFLASVKSNDIENSKKKEVEIKTLSRGEKKLIRKSTVGWDINDNPCCFFANLGEDFFINFEKNKKNSEWLEKAFLKQAKECPFWEKQENVDWSLEQLKNRFIQRQAARNAETASKTLTASIIMLVVSFATLIIAIIALLA